MNQQLSKLLILGGLLGAGFYAYNRYSKQTLALNKTCKILQEIKHQILIVTINYSEGTRQTIEKIKKTNPDKYQQVLQFFRNKMVEIYNQKQQLILGKHEISKEKFGQSLQFHKSNEKIRAIQQQIIDMMDKAVNGKTPNLDVDPRASKAFNKQKLIQIYEDMSKMILVHILTKFQKQEQINPNFDSNNQNHFKKAIRELNIYEKKVQFFKNRGFKQQWGCPNENFFKLSEGLKLKDADFKEQMKRLQKIYQEVVDVATKNPSSLTVANINNFYNRVPQPASKNIPHHHQEKHFVNLNSSTRSDPDQEQNQENASIFSKKGNNLPMQKFHSLKVEHQQKQKQPQVFRNQIQITVDNKIQQASIQIDDIPNDAHQLAKQTNYQVHVHEVSDQVVDERKQPQIKDKEEEKPDSNVSVDGDQPQPVAQQQQEHHGQGKDLKNTQQNKIHEQNRQQVAQKVVEN